MLLSATRARAMPALLAVQLLAGAAALAGCDSDSCDGKCATPERDAGDRPSDPDAAARDGGKMIALDEPLPDAGSLPYDCRVGVMDGVEKRYEELAPGGTIPIGGTGQAGLTARLALRCVPLDDSPALAMASIDLLLINPFTAVMAPRKSRPRGYDLVCDAEAVCDVVPILVEISHLTKLPELEGLSVRVDVNVRPVTDAGVLLGQARSHGVFQRL
jgi:hypothetical protein